jgi:hypothetical protein
VTSGVVVNTVKKKLSSYHKIVTFPEYLSDLTFGTQVRGFKPGRSRRIFQREKNPQRAFLRKGNKTLGPMSLIYGM